MHSLPEILNSIYARAEELGLSRAELARRAGITPEALSRLSGRKTARFDTIERLAAVVDRRLLDVPNDDYVRALQHDGLLDTGPADPDDSQS